MNAAGPKHGRLPLLIEEGTKLCIKQLADISGAAWSVAAVSWGEAPHSHLEPLFASSDDCHGSWFTMPGGVFLVVFPPQSGLLVTDRFTKEHADATDHLDKRDLKAVAEMSNILVNAFVRFLAEGLGRDIIISPPEMMTNTHHELLIKALKKLQDLKKLGLSCIVRLVSASLRAEFSIVIFLESEILTRLDA